MVLLSVMYFSRETYNALTNWLTDARTLASPNILIVLVGNKKDLEAEREVTFLEASRFAQENGESWSRNSGYLWCFPTLERINSRILDTLLKQYLWMVNGS